jgi:hypothetical protein
MIWGWMSPCSESSAAEEQWRTCARSICFERDQERVSDERFGRRTVCCISSHRLGSARWRPTQAQQSKAAALRSLDPQDMAAGIGSAVPRTPSTKTDRGEGHWRTYLRLLVAYVCTFVHMICICTHDMYVQHMVCVCTHVVMIHIYE